MRRAVALAFAECTSFQEVTACPPDGIAFGRSINPSNIADRSPSPTRSQALRLIWGVNTSRLVRSVRSI
jgi:hypothetical protein